MTQHPSRLITILREDILLSHWSIYHRAIAFALIGFMVLVVGHAVRVIDGGTYKLSESAVIRADAATIWAYIINPDQRYLWEAGVVQVQRMLGDANEPGSTRLLRWKSPRGARWSSFEETVTATPGLFFVADQINDDIERQIQIRLEPVDHCTTRITYSEILRETRYDARFIAPLARWRKHNRLEASLSGLARWMSRAAPNCSDNTAISKN